MWWICRKIAHKGHQVKENAVDGFTGTVAKYEITNRSHDLPESKSAKNMKYSLRLIIRVSTFCRYGCIYNYNVFR
jgi:2-iminoacetate synthase ThiH